MQRTKFFLLVLVAALILMGAGYAAWTQTFTINSTVTTGELFVQVSDEGITSVKVDDDGDSTTAGGGDYEVTVTAENDETYYLDDRLPTVATTPGVASGDGTTTLSDITYTIPHLYPGIQVTSEIDFQNLGTIGTGTAAGTATVTANSDMWDQLVIKVGVGEEALTLVTPGGGESKIDAVARVIAAKVGELEPGAAAKTITIVQELPFDSGTDTNASENETDITWSVQLTFEQFNAQ